MPKWWKMPEAALSQRIARWRADPITFIREVLRDPETGRGFALYPAQERFLREALTLTGDGKLPFPELIYSCPKNPAKPRPVRWRYYTSLSFSVVRTLKVT
jgi:hypothetical protein